MSGYLRHFGVLGMKWGVRKNRTTSRHPDSEQARNIGMKKLRSMTNDELKTYVKRRKLESEYKKKATILDRASAKKQIHEMSNKELKDFIKRKDLEKEFRNIKAGDVQEFVKWAGLVVQATDRVSARGGYTQ